MESLESRSFYVAPFAMDGEFLGVGEWRLADLSVKWLEFVGEVLHAGGSAFNKPLPSPFELVSLRFTSVQETALASFVFDGRPVASSLYLSGGSMVVEHELTRSFVNSMRAVDLVRQSQLTPEPFKEIFSISQRPIHIVISWPTESEEVGGTICELNSHFAAAFLLNKKLAR